MSLFNSLGASPQRMQPQQAMHPQQAYQPSQADMQKELCSIKSNPFNYLKSKGFNIPNGMTDAKQITQYLLQSGQVGNSRLQQVMRMIGYR